MIKFSAASILAPFPIAVGKSASWWGRQEAGGSCSHTHGQEAESDKCVRSAYLLFLTKS